MQYRLLLYTTICSDVHHSLRNLLKRLRVVSVRGLVVLDIIIQNVLLIVFIPLIRAFLSGFCNSHIHTTKVEKNNNKNNYSA